MEHNLIFEMKLPKYIDVSVTLTLFIYITLRQSTFILGGVVVEYSKQQARSKQ